MTTPPLRGPAIPFAIDSATGGVPSVEGAAKLAQNVRVILGTRAGERPMIRNFGTRLRELAQEPNDGGLAALMARQVREALAQIEPRVLVADVAFRGEGPTLSIDVTWLPADRPQPERLTIPVGSLA